MVAPDRRRDGAVAVFGTWMIIGLYLDGWAHQATKPETFFSPWHLLLYSGFVAAVAWFGWDGRREGASATPGDRWMTAGLVLFVTGAVGDGIWHEVFGIEVNLEALLSPTHLLLFMGGFLMVTLPLRSAAADHDDARPGWAEWWPRAATLTLGTGVIAFFTMYLSAFSDDGLAGRNQLGDLLEGHGIAKVLVTNALLVAPIVFVRRRWAAPTGTVVLLWTAVPLALTGLDGFRTIELVAAPVFAAIVVEVLLPRVPAMAAMAAGSIVAWSSYFALVAATTGVAWSVDLWAGTIVLATASSALLVVIGGPMDDRR